VYRPFGYIKTQSKFMPVAKVSIFDGDALAFYCEKYTNFIALCADREINFHERHCGPYPQSPA
jgi:hypothetical protein